MATRPSGCPSWEVVGTKSISLEGNDLLLRVLISCAGEEGWKIKWVLDRHARLVAFPSASGERPLAGSFCSVPDLVRVTKVELARKRLVQDTTDMRTEISAHMERSPLRGAFGTDVM